MDELRVILKELRKDRDFASRVRMIRVKWVMGDNGERYFPDVMIEFNKVKG